MTDTLDPTAGPRARCSECGATYLGAATLTHHDDGSHTFAPMTDTPDRSELRRLADAATQGPWYLSGRLLSGTTFFGDNHWNVRSGEKSDPERGPHATTSGVHSEADAAYIAAMSPDVTLTLLSALDSRDARIASLIERIEALEPVYDDDGEPMEWAVFRSEVVAEARAALGSASGTDDGSDEPT